MFRQRLLNRLVSQLGYAEENIGVEVPMAHFKKGVTGGADIVIFDRPFRKGEDAQPLILIECKDPENHKQDIKEYRFEKQLERYAKVLKPVFAIITNERETDGIDLRNQKRLFDIPSVKDIEKNKIRYYKPAPYKWKRHSFDERSSKKLRKQYEDDYICWKTKDEVIPMIIQLMDLIYDTALSFNPLVLSDNLILKQDLGLRRSNYGFAGSGGLIGDYRCLLVEEKSDGNEKIIGYSIYPQESYDGTYLMIAVDGRKGHALELKLDKHIKPTGEATYQIFHNLVLTAGNKGRTPNSVVLKEIAQKAPFLLKDGKVLLGTFDVRKDLKFQQPEVKDFILRTTTYGILRDEIRAKASK